MINRKDTLYYELKMRYNKYKMVRPLACTAQRMASRCLLYTGVSSSKINNHCLHVNNGKGKLGIGYDIIIGRDLVLQIGLLADFKCESLQWYGVIVHMKEPISMIGQTAITKREIRKVVMQNEEPDYS